MEKEPVKYRNRENLGVISLPSQTKSIMHLESFVEKVFEYHKVEKGIFGNVLICLTEAVTNAIVHGNKENVDKYVHIKTTLKESLIGFTIVDEGPGFDYNDIPDPTSPENISNTGGRGVFLMRQLSDEIKFSKGGSSVEIKFNI